MQTRAGKQPNEAVQYLKSVSDPDLDDCPPKPTAPPTTRSAWRRFQVSSPDSGSAESPVASCTPNRSKQEGQDKYNWPAVNVLARVANPQAEENGDVNAFVAALATVYREAIPVRMDMTKIAMCKQQEDETVSQYLMRLTEVHNVHTRLRPPEDITAAEITPYEAHLRNSFINGMKDEIAKKMVTQPLEEGAEGKEVAEEALAEVDLAGALFAEQWTTGRGNARTDSPNRPWRLSDRVTNR
ncbi:uncharacterized protein LOC122550781 [Chiloscyllium plagiosum]|uniref:uncharacterized protein LOC122550781 n=1 Tax=Chiloscyllium plagiosum TaxID=36176 RepID=UPI001CB7CBCD|nr:uncharacterized protein LOC122550781 [Chiloscyllium plagiosum]XP_043547980.1 uncharacterized protein LOC122550781 [Chiloscyllium plagiosum]